MKFLVSFLTIVSFNFSAFAFPVAPFTAQIEDELSHSQNLFFNQSVFDQYDFTGIVKLSNCSGSLIVFKGQAARDKALVLTNGHCLGNFVPPGQAIINQEVQRKFLLYNKRGDKFPINSIRLLYATMTGTDSAIYELEQTYEEIINGSGIMPLVMSDQPPRDQLPIEILSGFWERGFSCKVEKTIPVLKEADWTFTNSIKYLQPGCETFGGTSGSPIIATGTRIVVGINNTGNQDGGECTMNNPCEVYPNGDVVATKGASYGQQTFGFYACLTQELEIDPNLPGCTLTK